jgi:hypothetical protein
VRVVSFASKNFRKVCETGLFGETERHGVKAD